MPFGSPTKKGRLELSGSCFTCVLPPETWIDPCSSHNSMVERKSVILTSLFSPFSSMIFSTCVKKSERMKPSMLL